MRGGIEPNLLAWHMGTKDSFSEGRGGAFALGASDMHDIKRIEIFWLLLRQTLSFCMNTVPWKYTPHLVTDASEVIMHLGDSIFG